MLRFLEKSGKILKALHISRPKKQTLQMCLNSQKGKLGTRSKEASRRNLRIGQKMNMTPSKMQQKNLVCHCVKWINGKF